MQRVARPRPRLLLATCLLGAGLAGCTAQAICTKEAECADDPPGEDFVRICQVQYDGAIAALRTNEEDECHALANALLAFDACRAALECRDFEEGDLNGECKDEAKALEHAYEDVRDDECTGREGD